jgi:two-component system response regulator RegA
MGSRAWKRYRQPVLVVDDDPLIQKVSHLTLARAGIDAVVAGSVAEALAQLASHRFRVAILDYFLAAGECGCDLIAPLRAHNRSIRIVVLSGLAILPELIHHAHRAGADLIASKSRVDWLALVRAGRSVSPARVEPAVDLAELRRQTVHGAYLVHHRNVSDTARALGISRTTLQRMLRKRPLPDREED